MNNNNLLNNQNVNVLQKELKNKNNKIKLLEIKLKQLEKMKIKQLAEDKKQQKKQQKIEEKDKKKQQVEQIKQQKIQQKKDEKEKKKQEIAANIQHNMDSLKNKVVNRPNKDEIKKREEETLIKLQKVKDIVLKIVKEQCPALRKTLYSDEYIYDNIYNMLKHFTTWRTFRVVYDKKPFNHYSTIFKRFTKWREKGVFKLAYQKIFKDYVLDKIDDDEELLLYIDSMSNTNLGGIDCKGKGENKKKNQTKITVVCDSKKNVYCPVLISSASEHDANTVIPIIEELRTLLKNKIELVGDKGFLLGQNKLHILETEKNTKMCVPKRKNQKEKTNEIEKQKLKGRYVVENVLKESKSYNRIQNRQEKKVVNYACFLYLALSLKFHEFDDRSTCSIIYNKIKNFS